MSEPETFAIEGLDVTVTETADALTYTLKPRSPALRFGVPVSVVFLLVVLPLGLLGLIGYALDRTNADRPEWELALTTLCAIQLLVWLLMGVHVTWGMFRHARQSGAVLLTFTRTEVMHGDERVCELAELRGVRLFLFESRARLLADENLPRGSPPDPNAKPLPPEFEPIPASERPSPIPQASLSLIVGDEGYTHGLFGWMAPAPLRSFAEHLQRRLNAFRHNLGLAALEALSVVETTEEDVDDLMHTRPKTGLGRRFVVGLGELLMQNRWGGAVWCGAMLAGLFASGRMVLASGLGTAFLVGHGFVGLFHLLLLMYHIGGHSPAKRPNAQQ